MGEVRDQCGIIVAHEFEDVYNGLVSLQHRGQEAAGVAIKHDDGIDIVKWLGRVRDFKDHYLGHLLRAGERRNGIYMGHVRYSTSGAKRDVRNAHPHFIGGDITNHDNHMIVRNARIAGVHNGTLVGEEFQTGDESDTMKMLRLYENIGADGIIRRIPAAYSVAIMDADKKEVVALRDRHGMRPLATGERRGRFVVASEDRAIYAIGGHAEEELRPGSIVYISSDVNGFRFEDVITDSPQRYCFFERNYLCHWQTHLGGESVKVIRRKLGNQLAKEFHPDDVDIITYVPTTPYSIVKGYGMGVGIETTEIFYKMTADRSFINDSETDRVNSIQGNLYVRDDVDLRDKVVLIVDDSVVRGNVNEDAAMKCKERGAKKVYFVSATPPIGGFVDSVPRGCLYGIDMPPDDKFIWRESGEDVKMMSEHSKYVDEYYYISKDGMFSSYNEPRENFCHYCIGGPDPLK